MLNLEENPIYSSRVLVVGTRQIKLRSARKSRRWFCSCPSGGGHAPYASENYLHFM